MKRFYAAFARLGGQALLAIVLLATLGAVRVNAQAQTAVTGTIVDPNGIPYANATVKAQLQPAGPPSPCVVTGGNCVPIQGTVGPVPTSSSGVFAISLYPNASITPGGTQWLFTVSISPGGALPIGTGPQTFSVLVTIAGSSQDVSATLSAAAPALSNVVSTGGYPYPIIVVDGTKITTVAQALALLPNSPVTNTPAGTIDARGCAASSLNLGTYDPGSGGVTLLLGACNYGVDSIVEEPGEQIIGEGDYQNATNVIYNSTAPDNVAIIVPNSAGNDISNLVYTNFLLGTFTGTNIGCMVVGPIPANNSSVVATITKMSFFNESPDAAAPCIILNGQGIVAGEQSINAFNITNNEFQWGGNRNTSTPILTISGTSSGIVYQGNYGGNEVTGGGPAIVCTDAPTPAFPPAGILIDGNSFLFAAQPVSNTGCLGMSILGNEYNGSGALPDMSNGFPIATYTGATTPGHIATWNALGILQDGGAAPATSTTILANYYSTLSSPISLTATTVTPVISQSVTMPSSGCPCRAIIHYSVLWSSLNGTLDTDVTDGTNAIATSQAAGIGTSVGGMTGSQVSQVTYANSAVVPFVLQAETTVGGTIEATPVLLGQNTFLSISIVTSQ